MPTERESDPLRDDLAFALRWLRALHGWRQGDFAEAAGLDVRTLQRYELGAQGVPEEALERLVRAARLPRTLFDNVLLPAVRVLRAAIGREGDDPGEEEKEEPLEAIASRVGREIAETVRAVVLEHYLNLDREEKERERGSWYPTGADEKAVPDLLHRLTRYGETDRRFLIENARPFQSWALVRYLADSVAGSAAEGAGSPVSAPFGSPPERAALALRVALSVPGPEAWNRRVRAYATAALARAGREGGDPAGAAAAAAEAERLWTAGVDEAGVLDERAFRKLLGSPGP